MTFLATVPEAERQAELEDLLKPMRQAISAKECGISAAERQLATLVAEDAELCAAINENRRLAAIPEPDPAEFSALEEWHGALRKRRAYRVGLDEALAPLEAERSRMVTRIASAEREIGVLRFELAQAEFDLAKDELLLVQRHAEATRARVRRLQVALATVKPT